MIIGQLAGILGPIVIITAIGYLLGRLLPEMQWRALSTVVILVATPALVFHTLTSLDIDAGTIGDMAVAAALCLTLAGLLGLLALKITGAPVRSMLPGLMMPNSGNMGLPLVVLAFGDEGMRLGVSYFFVVALVQHSVGLSIAAGSFRILHLARQPLVYSVLLVLLVMLLDLTVPEVVLTTTRMLGNMMIPAMLILLGASLASLHVADLRPALAVAGGRLGIGLVTAFCVIWVLGLTGVPAGAVFLLATMPSAIVTYLFAERYQQSPRLVAGAVVISTLLTFCVLPVLVPVALWIAGPVGGLAE